MPANVGTNVRSVTHNWFGPVAVKLRNMAAATRATLYPQAGGLARVVLDLPQDGIAAGQACVVYALNSEGQASSRVLGGGWISAAERVEVAA